MIRKLLMLSAVFALALVPAFLPSTAEAAPHIAAQCGAPAKPISKAVVASAAFMRAA